MNSQCLRCHRVAPIFGLAFILWAVLVPAAFAADVTYQWTDADGVIHFTDDAGKIPENFRDSAQEIRHPDEPKKKPSPAPESESQPEIQPEHRRMIPSEAVDDNGHNREWWQDRVQEWQSIKADAQAKLADAQEQLGRARYLDSTPAQSKKVQEISAEISKYEKKIQEADSMLTDGLADEARQANAPPGWLGE